MSDSLDPYRKKRAFDRTPEPDGAPGGTGGNANRFVIQEHHARRLHWDLRLEREGVLVSWALPRGVPAHPDQDRLAVHTEDHPLAYIDFHGEIPAGQYGAGSMEIWDRGTYEAEKFEPGKVVLAFAGERVSGRYSLFQTRGENWMIHRMDPPEPGRERLPEEIEPMTTGSGELPADDEDWGFEIKWEGRRALAFCEPGHLRLAAGEIDLTKRCPEVRGILEQLHGSEALLDGVLVAFGADARPDPDRLGRRIAAESGSAIRRLRKEAPISFVAFDLLHLEGGSLLDRPYRARRDALEGLGLDGPAWRTPAYHRGDGRALLSASRQRGLGGIVGKRLASAYRPGTESPDWVAVSYRLT